MDFEKIWDKHKIELKQFIMSKVHDEVLSQDILQEVSLKLHQALNQMIKINNPRAWLYQVTRNTIIDHFRKESRHQSSQEDLRIEPVANSTEACVCDLSGFVIKNYLPDKYAIPLFMSDVEQKPQQEIADTLKLSLTATKSRIQRARIKLKELISDCIELSYNSRGQITDFQLKSDCQLPDDLLQEIKRLNLTI